MVVELVISYANKESATKPSLLRQVVDPVKLSLLLSTQIKVTGTSIVLLDGSWLDASDGRV